jgi:hypothetical protein
MLSVIKWTSYSVLGFIGCYVFLRFMSIAVFDTYFEIKAFYANKKEGDYENEHSE